MEYFPNHKGLITGIIVGSYGLGSAIFNLLATFIVNPNKENATIPSSSDKNLKFFEPSVANRVPLMFRILCIIWATLVFLSALLISLPKTKK